LTANSAQQVAIAFLGLARDCVGSLPIFFRFVDSLDQASISSVVLIGENGSTDGTRELLERRAAEGRLQVVDTGFMAGIPRRLQRMAQGREKVKLALKNSGARPAYVCVVDLDRVMTIPPRVEDFTQAMELLANDERLFAVSADSKPYFYDLLAYEDDELSFAWLPHKSEEVATMRPRRYYGQILKHISAYQRSLTKLGDRLCISSFNGMCIYKASYYSRASYLATGKVDICEHLVLNRSIFRATGRRILITRFLTLRTPAEQMPIGPIAFWVQQIYKKLRRMGSRSQSCRH
jgi:hypothetical protein